MNLKIIAISDSHNKHEYMRIPDGDILIHSGDATMLGTYIELSDFINWFGNLPHKHKIWVAGNHDWGMDNNGKDFLKWCQRRGRTLIDLTNIKIAIEMECKKYGIHLLDKSGIEIDGIKIWGAPDNPQFGGWAFNRNNTELTQIWKGIPDDTNILITHAPPYGILDVTMEGDMVGDVPLLKRLNTLPDLKLHVFGHIHESAGIKEVNGITHINASMLDRYYCTNTYTNPAREFEYVRHEDANTESES